DARERLEQREDLELADGLVLLPLRDHLGERPLRVLEAILDLCAGLPGCGGLLERCRSLFGSQRRESHARHLLVVGPAIQHASTRDRWNETSDPPGERQRGRTISPTVRTPRLTCARATVTRSLVEELRWGTAL